MFGERPTLCAQPLLQLFHFCLLLTRKRLKLSETLISQICQPVARPNVPLEASSFLMSEPSSCHPASAIRSHRDSTHG